MSEKFKGKDNKAPIFIENAGVELHAHPFLGKNKIMDIARAIEMNNLNVVALEEMNNSIYSKLKKGIQAYFPNTVDDAAGIRYDGERFILNAGEYETKEGFHLLTIGHSIYSLKKDTEIRKLIDETLQKNAIPIIAHPFVDNGRTLTAGHISKEKEKELADLCSEYPGQIALEWNGYCHPGIRKVLKGVLNIMGQNIEYFDVNKKAYDFANSPEIIKHKIPVVPGTDVHATNKKHLFIMGTSTLFTNIKGETPEDILNSIKENIFLKKDYAFADSYVSAAHLVSAFGIPVLKQNYKRILGAQH